MFDTCHQRMKADHIALAVGQERPDVIALSFLSTTTYPAAKSTARRLKAEAPEIPIIVGGAFATLNADRILGDCPDIDCVGVGGGEELLPDYLDHLDAPDSVTGLVWRRDGAVIKNPPRPLLRDLNRYPYPDRSSLPIGHRFGRRNRCARLGRLQESLGQLGVRDPLGQRPSQSGRLGSPQIVTHRAGGQATTVGDLSHREVVLVFESKYVFNVTHGYWFSCHQVPSVLEGPSFWHLLKRHATPTESIRSNSDTCPILLGQSSNPFRTLVRRSRETVRLLVGCPSDLLR